MARAMPNNLEAEMSVLGCAFLGGNLVDKIVEEMHAEMFFDERNKVLFNAIVQLHNEKNPVDITTIKNELDKVKKLNIVGLDYLTDVIDSVAISSNLDYYISIVKENALRRNLIETATDIVSKAYDEDNLNVLLDNSEQEILNV